MGIEEVNRIKNEFINLKLHPIYLEHEPVITSEDAAKTRGFELRQGIKAILFTDEKENYVIADIPADKKVDQKKVATKMNWPKGNIRMATPKEVLEKTGCEIGAVPPFGHKTKIPILVDTQIYQNKDNSFNIGLRTHSVKIPSEEMKIIFDKFHALEGDFVK